MRIKVLRFEQPAGSFLVGTMNAVQLIEIGRIERREYDVLTLSSTGGVQRQPSAVRVAEIARYCNTADASFPTPIILGIPLDSFTLDDDQNELTFDSKSSFATVVDGQHRLLGIKDSGRAQDFDLPVVFLLDPTAEQEALIFATINGKQTRVPASLIYDLFAVTRHRSPEKTAHEIARALNSDPTSPWYKKLKMLGRSTGTGGDESLTQGTFVRELLKHISSQPPLDRDAIKRQLPLPLDPKAPVLRQFFEKGEDQVIAKILHNLFSAQKAVWNEEWTDSTRSILRKSTGFMATMYALPTLIRAGIAENKLTEAYFEGIFRRADATLRKTNRALTAQHFTSNAPGIALLRKVFEDAASNNLP
ncbi:MAG: DGQHR domain-containing protein [Gemmatimonadaceae bacterium]